MASYGGVTKSSSSKEPKAKTFLQKKELLSKKDIHDNTVVSALVRRYEYGYTEARFSVDAGERGLVINCDPQDSKSHDEALSKIEHLEYCLAEFKKAIKEASKG